MTLHSDRFYPKDRRPETGVWLPGLEDTLGVLAVPAPHRLKLSSANMVESIMKRLRKRTRVVGIFPNRSSCQRLIGRQLLELHEQWQAADEMYLNMAYAGA